MRLEGNVAIVEDIETLLKALPNVKCIKQGDNGQYEQWLGKLNGSAVYSRVYHVNHYGTVIPIRLQFDQRCKRGRLVGPSKLILRLCDTWHSFRRLIQLLRPYYNEDGRGEFLVAMDKIIGVKGEWYETKKDGKQGKSQTPAVTEATGGKVEPPTPAEAKP
jgi:hypothetical protein